jgi:hypothetical protein
MARARALAWERWLADFLSSRELVELKPDPRRQDALALESRFQCVMEGQSLRQAAAGSAG